MKAFVAKLKDMGACSEAVCWAGTQPSWPALWRQCERADWMLWLLGKLAGPVHSPSRKTIVACASECAATAIEHARDAEMRKALADVTARLKGYSESEAAGTAADAELNYIRGDVRALRAAAASADASAADASADAAAYAAAYAAYAADASAADAAAAAAAASAASAAAYAASAAAAAAAAYAAAAAAAAARRLALAAMAEIVRRHYPTPPSLGRAVCS